MPRQGGTQVAVIPGFTGEGPICDTRTSPWAESTSATCAKAATGLVWANHPGQVYTDDYEPKRIKSYR